MSPNRHQEAAGGGGSFPGNAAMETGGVYRTAADPCPPPHLAEGPLFKALDSYQLLGGPSESRTPTLTSDPAFNKRALAETGEES